MKHLTAEQLEDVLLTGSGHAEHLASCSECRARLAERHAIRDRVQGAFVGLKAPEALAERIKGQLADGLSTKPAKMPTRSIAFSFRWSTWAVGSAIAAVLAAGFLILFHFGVLPLESVAQAQLVQVHQANLTPDPHFVTGSDPDKLMAHLQSQLGYAPKPPQPVKNTSLRGCCVRRYCATRVGCYVLDTPRGVVSIVVINNHPQSLGMEKQTSCARCIQCTCWKKSLGKVNAAAIQLGEYSYYAVGDLPQGELTAILMAAYPSNPS